MPRCRGHTLAEMLVAIGIMAVVIGLVLSVFIQLIRVVKGMQH